MTANDVAIALEQPGEGVANGLIIIYYVDHFGLIRFIAST
jgi:hypothetical protein